MNEEIIIWGMPTWVQNQKEDKERREGMEHMERNARRVEEAFRKRGFNCIIQKDESAGDVRAVVPFVGDCCNLDVQIVSDKKNTCTTLISSDLAYCPRERAPEIKQILQDFSKSSFLTFFTYEDEDNDCDVVRARYIQIYVDVEKYAKTIYHITLRMFLEIDRLYSTLCKALSSDGIDPGDNNT